MRIKHKLFFLIVIFSFSSLAFSMEVGPFIATGLTYFKNKNITAYLVSGIGILGKEITINNVYKTYPTQKIPEDGVVNFEPLNIKIIGFRRPTHIVLIIHDQKRHALNSVVSGLTNGLPMTFEPPNYVDRSEIVSETNENKRLLYRKSIMLKVLKESGEVNFND